ncbi:MAG: hypothetical protein Q8R12_01400, partial [bacterium]|nr:hypothetical protein [bacterium]
MALLIYTLLGLFVGTGLVSMFFSWKLRFYLEKSYPTEWDKYNASLGPIRWRFYNWSGYFLKFMQQHENLRKDAYLMGRISLI